MFQFFLRCEVRSVIILGISSNIFVNLSNLLLSAQENAFVSWPLKVRSELVLVISDSHFRNHSNLFVMSILGTVLRILVMTLFSTIKVYYFLSSVSMFSTSFLGISNTLFVNHSNLSFCPQENAFILKPLKG